MQRKGDLKFTRHVAALPYCQPPPVARGAEIMRQASNATRWKLLADEQVCWQTLLTLLIQIGNVTDLCPVSFTLRMSIKLAQVN